MLGAFTLAMCAQKSFAQATFSVVCPKTEIGKNDLLSIEFKVENAEYIETIIPPTFNDFTIVSGPNQQRGMRSVNGKTDTYVSIGFSLQPTKPGTYKIGSAKAIADGKEFKTNPVTIKVTNKTSTTPSAGQGSNSPFSGFGPGFAPPRPSNRFDDYILKPGENPDEKVRNNLFLKLDLNKTDCYVGEPLTASFKLYSRLRCETQITDAPSFNGFSVSELDFDNNVQIEEYNGRKYNVYVLRKVQLYPMREGDITLSPLVANNRVTFLKSDYADRQRSDQFFNLLENFIDETSPENSVIEKNIEIKSEARTVHVKPLPDKDVPANFKGAVGEFSVEAKVDKQELTTDDAGNLQITISGSGNIQLVNAPVISWPDGIEGFEARMKENLDKSAVPMSGRKVFTYPFTLSKAGNLIIPSITFSWFDPGKAVYKTVNTKPITLQVKAGTKKRGSIGKSKSGESSTLFKVSKSEIAFGIAGTILIILLILLFRRNQSIKKENSKKDIILDDLENKVQPKEEAFTIPENPLLEAHEKLTSGNANEFFIVLNTSMKKYLSEKFKIPTEEFSRKRIYEEMDTCNVGIGTSHMVNSLLEEIEMNLYSMPQQQHLQNAFEKASEVVALLDKQCQGREKS